MRRTACGAALLSAAVVAAGGGVAHPSEPVEVIATGVSRPSQLAVDGRSLIVLSPGRGGAAAGEIYRVDLDADAPVDLSRQASIRIPFAGEGATTTLGSLAVDPQTHDLFLGEENGTRIYRLSTPGRLALYATGLRRLAGGTTLAFDTAGRLVIIDNADPLVSPAEDWPPPGLEQFRDEDYRGPLVFRLTLDPALPLPRRPSRLAPLFPRAWGGARGGGALPRLLSVVALGPAELRFLTSGGEMLRLTSEGTLTPVTRLPPGQYNRISMAAGPEGEVVVSGGFHTGRVFRVSRDGTVSELAAGLGDPQGVALDAQGRLYVAESARHRIVRLRAL